METADNTGKTTRLGYFDIAKGIGIILVVIAHIEYVDLGIRNYIVSFHMPLFFVVSGMLSAHINEFGRPAKTVILKKLKRIMLPYLVFSVLFPVIDIVYFYITGNGDPFGTLRQNIYDSLVLYGYSVLWFLPTAFFGDMFFFFVMKAASKIAEKYASVITFLVTLGISLIICFLFGHTGDHFIVAMVRFFPASCLVSAGNLLYILVEKMRSRKVLAAAAGVFLLVLLVLIHGFNGTVDMHFGVYGKPVLYFINALIGSLGVILISAAIDVTGQGDGSLGQGDGSLFREKPKQRTVPLSQTVPLSRSVAFYGRNSLFVMITHINFYILYCAEVLSFRITEYIPRAKNIVFNLMTVVFVLAAEFVLIKIYEIGKMKTVSLIRKNG